MRETTDVRIPRELFDFLLGAGPLDGCWFGDRNPPAPGAFWWRKELSKCAALEQAPKPAGEDLRAVAVDNNKVHPTHRTRISMDASTYDEICDACGATDHVPGGLGRLIYPCPNYEAPKPAGGEWVTVPREPTPEMANAALKKASDKALNTLTNTEATKLVIAAALATAPTPRALDAALTPSEDVAGVVERDEARRQLVAAWNAFGLPEKRAERPVFDVDDLNNLPLWGDGDLAEQIEYLEDRADRLERQNRQMVEAIRKAINILYHNLGRQDEKVRDVEPILRAALTETEGKADV